MCSLHLERSASRWLSTGPLITPPALATVHLWRAYAPSAIMLAPKSTHKRKRSSVRTDKARKLGAARWIVNLLPPNATTSSLTSTSTEEAKTHTESSQTSRLEQLVNAHPLNRSLELILPMVPAVSGASPDSNTELPDSVRSLIARLEHIASCHKSYRARIPLSLLLDPLFVTAYLKTGSLIALSDPSPAPGLSPGQEDMACIDGQGTLVLSLCKDTYQTLGLTGRASHFSRLSSGRAADRTSGPDSRFIVQLPLLSPSFVPGKKGYQQALDRLRQWDRTRARVLSTQQTIAQSHASSSMQSSAQSAETVSSKHATWDMLFVWSPSRACADTIAAVSSSSASASSMNEIAFPEHLVRPDDVECLSLQPNTVITHSVWIPKLSDPDQHSLGGGCSENERHFTDPEPPRKGSALSTWSAYQDGLQEAIEWAGLASLGADALRTFTRPDATCVYSPPSCSLPGRVLKLTWSGSAGSSMLLSPLFIIQVAEQVNRLILESSCTTNPEHVKEYIDWAALSCSGFPHAPLSWRSKVAFSSLYGAKELSGSKRASRAKTTLSAPLESEKIGFTDASSSEDDDQHHVDSDSSLDVDGLQSQKRKRKKRCKRNVGKNHTEHSFTAWTGETGWISFCLGTRHREPVPAPTPRSCRWVLVELIGTDTRS